jgi:hypothetical protein
MKKIIISTSNFLDKMVRYLSSNFDGILSHDFLSGFFKICASATLHESAFSQIIFFGIQFRLA